MRLDWIAPPGVGADISTRLVLTGSVEDSAETGRLVSIVDIELAKCLEQDDFYLLRYFNQGLKEIRFDDQIVDLLFAGRFTPGDTFWYDYRFEGVFQEENNRFRVTFLGPAGQVVLEIRAAGTPIGDQSSLQENPIFSLSVVGDARQPANRELVYCQVERFFGFLLSRSIHPGMSLEAGQQPSRCGDSECGLGPISSGSWGNPNQWFQFFSDHEIECNNLCSLQLSDSFSWVNHGELECMDHEPHVMSGTVSYVNMPWLTSKTLGPPGSRFWVSRILEEDVIRGGTNRLEQTLEKAINNPKARFVCVSNTCLPKIIGDDVMAVVNRFQKKCSVPILCLSNDLSSPDMTFEDLVIQAMDRFSSTDEDDDRLGLNLVGFPPNRDEILSDLEKLSIPVNTCLLPEIGIETFQKYHRAELSIVYPFQSWISIADNALFDSRVPHQVVEAPYGFRKTLDWFRIVANAMGRGANLKDFEAQRLAPLKAGWDRLTDEAGSYGLAFVISAQTSEHLTNARRHYGFELLSLLEEMGFRLHVMLKVESPDDSLPLSKMRDSLADSDRHVFSGFSNEAQLASLLANEKITAIYSEISFDERILKAGKAQFNLSMIEMGFDGALRSLDRLLRLCKSPFYKRYAKYLLAGDCA
jgi:nitrogenase molybdenum-iron protein alpha/beta subunit